MESTNEFRRDYNRSDLKVAGIVFNIVTNSREAMASKREIKALARQYEWPWFEEEISFSDSYTRSVREISSIMDTRYARASTTDEFRAFAEAFSRTISL
ncbi:hypothetical protein [Pullulanibacillus pueri]|uniref:hypothetical protein n=1 Tax=Pullulanibacillus pueri TaxID=1437324 RepID=UPI0016667FD8|nr:hypothetical protein [Pullulanibacillus pueri]